MKVASPQFLQQRLRMSDLISLVDAHHHEVNRLSIKKQGVNSRKGG